jgi:L-2,4-diaminobutyrate decarboxylase
VRSFLCSRRADVIKLWVAIQRYGSRGLGELYDHLCEVASAMHAQVVAHPGFEALHEPESNILCFRWIGSVGGKDRDEFNRELRERYNRSGAGWITSTVVGGVRVLRVTIMNARTTSADTQEVIEGLAREAGQMVQRETV